MAPTLLVADESITIQRVVDLLFAAHDIKVVAVSDGEQAVEYLRSTRPDAVLVNANLQKRDGFEVARFVQSQPSLQRVPVLLSAGAFDSIDEDRVRAVGAAGVLFKPFEPGQVINRVKELLGLAPVLESTAPPRTDGADSAALHLEEWFTERTHAEGIGTGGTGDMDAAGEIGAAGDIVVGHAGVGISGASLGDVRAMEAHTSPAAPAMSPAAPMPPVSPSFGPADAFAVLLAAEQGEAVGPVLSQPVVELSDGMVERIADRVAERLMHSAFGESLRGTVQDVSERLVREEIQRIRASAHTQQ
jgi:CheY-like chemotaxis protein